MSKEQLKPQKENGKIHKTHFPIVKVPLKDTGFDSGYEWVDKGNGHWVRVPKKVEAEEVEQTENQQNEPKTD